MSETEDLFRIITDLERAGWTLRAIGKSVGASKSAVYGWKCGRDPRHRFRVKLLALHAEAMKDRLPNLSGIVDKLRSSVSTDVKARKPQPRVPRGE